MKKKLANLIQSYDAISLSKELDGIKDIQSAINCIYVREESVFCCSHQRRVRKSELSKLCEKLLCEVNLIYSATSFEEIYHIVANAKIKHIGNLTIYDISLHIAYLLNPKALLPKAFVYLNAGAMVGAMALYNKGLLKVKPTHKMDVNELDDILSGLMRLDIGKYGILKEWTFAMLVEDFLCSKHSALLAL